MSAPARRGVAEIAADIRAIERHLREGHCTDPDHRPGECRRRLDALFAELDAVRAAGIRRAAAGSETGTASAGDAIDQPVIDGAAREIARATADSVDATRHEPAESHRPPSSRIRTASADFEPVHLFTLGATVACNQVPLGTSTGSTSRLGLVTCPACAALFGVRGELMALFPGMSAEWKAATVECDEDTAAALVGLTRSVRAGDQGAIDGARFLLAEAKRVCAGVQR